MLVAQRLGWTTVNGYSGNTPPGWAPMNCDKARHQIVAYRNWMEPGSSRSRVDELLKHVVYVGWPDCGPSVRSSASEANQAP
jgi:hypothetical protein